jgi:hypothetical protein
MKFCYIVIGRRDVSIWNSSDLTYIFGHLTQQITQMRQPKKIV